METEKFNTADVMEVNMLLRIRRLRWQRDTLASALRDALLLIGDPNSTVIDVQYMRRVGERALATLTTGD